MIPSAISNFSIIECSSQILEIYLQYFPLLKHRGNKFLTIVESAKVLTPYGIMHYLDNHKDNPSLIIHTVQKNLVEWDDFTEEHEKEQKLFERTHALLISAAVKIYELNNKFEIYQ